MESYIEKKFWDIKRDIVQQIFFCTKRLELFVHFSGTSLYAKAFLAGQVNILVYEIYFLESLMEKY